MKKLLACMLVSVLMVTCAGMSIAQADAVELQFWTWRPEDVEFYDAVIKEFEAANPDIKVVQNAIKSTDYNTALSAALQGGGPDVFMTRAHGGLQTFTDSGFVLAIDDLVPELQAFDPAKLLGSRSATDGKLYGVPLASHTMFCYYNTAVYEKLGLKIPTTWAEFLANLEATKAAGYDALANGTKDAWICEVMMGAVAPSFYGGNAFADKVVAGETDFNDPVFVAAVDRLNELKPYLPNMFEGVAYADMQASFANEVSAHFLGGSFEAGTFLSINPELKFDVFAIPGEKAEDPAFVSVYADGNYSVNANTPNQEAALKFLKYFTTVEFGNAMVSKLSMMSPVPGVDLSASPFLTRVTELQKNATPYLFLVNFRYQKPTGSELFQPAAQGMLSGTLSAADACKQVQDGIATYYKPFQK